jgi:hypothetical protein
MLLWNDVSAKLHDQTDQYWLYAQLVKTAHEAADALKAMVIQAVKTDRDTYRESSSLWRYRSLFETEGFGLPCTA